MPKMTDVCSGLTLRHMDRMIEEASKDATAARELLKTPKVFFNRHGFSVPPQATLIVKATKDLHAAMDKRGKNVFTKKKTVTGHIRGGAARCTVIIVR